MKRKTRVLIIGNFGYKQNQLDGQTVKTRNVSLLLTKMGYVHVNELDTSYKLNPLFNLGQLFKKQLIVFLGAENSFRYFLPLLLKISRITSSEIHYIHIGSVLIDILKSMPKKAKHLNRIKGNYAETVKIAKTIEGAGVNNVKVMPNFRVIDEVKIKPERANKNDLRLVYFGRIMKEKGIDIIFKAYELLKTEFENGKVRIDFYGQVVDEALNFENELKSKQGLNYLGHLEPEEIHKKLNDYDMLIFPTYFQEEGFPGTILDAFLSGIPVLASDWMYNSELVENEKSGMLVEPKSHEALANAIQRVINDKILLSKLKNGAFAKGRQLDYRNVIEILEAKISDSFKS